MVCQKSSPTLTDGGQPKTRKYYHLWVNTIGLLQFIICFAMLAIFSYNSYGTYIMLIWVFALTIMALGSITLGIFIILASRWI